MFEVGVLAVAIHFQTPWGVVELSGKGQVPPRRTPRTQKEEGWQNSCALLCRDFAPRLAYARRRMNL